MLLELDNNIKINKLSGKKIQLVYKVPIISWNSNDDPIHSLISFEEKYWNKNWILIDYIYVKPIYEKKSKLDVFRELYKYEYKLKSNKPKFLQKVSQNFGIKLKHIGIITKNESLFDEKLFNFNNYLLDDIIMGIRFTDYNWNKIHQRNEKINIILDGQ